MISKAVHWVLSIRKSMTTEVAVYGFFLPCLNVLPETTLVEAVASVPAGR